MSSRPWLRTQVLAVLLTLTAAGLGAGHAQANMGDDDLLDALGDVALFVETETLVAGATRRVSKLSETPGTVTVLKGEELRDRGVLTLEEAIRYVSSITFSPGTIALTTSIRDVEQAFNNKVLLLIDGRIVNGVFRGNFFADLSQPIDNVARIEVVRGPGSALYGANAFAGFINVVTRKGDEIDGVEFRATVGTEDLGHLSFLAGREYKDYNWSVDARMAQDEPVDPVNGDEPNTEHRDNHLAVHWGKGGVAGEEWFANFSFTDVDAGVPGSFRLPTPGDRLKEQRIALDGFRLWKPSSKTKLKLRSYYSRQDNDYDFRRADIEFFALTDKLIRSTPRVAYDTELNPLDSSSETLPDPTGEPDQGCILCDQIAVGVVVSPLGIPPAGGSFEDYESLLTNGLPEVTDQIDSVEWQAFAELQADWKVSDSNYLLGGLSVRADDVDNAIVGSRQFKNYAFFLEDEQRFLDDELILLGSLRFDDHSHFGMTTSPRASLIWSPNRKLLMKGSFGKAFRSPNFVELFGESRIGAARIFGQQRAVSDGVIPESFERCLELADDGSCLVSETLNTELQQEEIESFELWTEYTPNDRFKVILNLYHFEITNEVGIALDRNDIYFFAEGRTAREILGPSTPPFRTFFALPGLENVTTLGVFLNAPDETVGLGAELEAHVDPTDWLGMRFKYSRRDTKRAEVGSFVEEDADSDQQTLVPTFGTRTVVVDQMSGELDFRPKKQFWGSFRFRLLGRPNKGILEGGESLVADMTVGLRRDRYSVAATVLNLNNGGTLYSPDEDRFVSKQRHVRLTFGFRHAF